MNDVSQFAVQLRRFWHVRRREVHVQHHRTLPLGDYVVDRWERASEVGFGQGSSVYDSCLIIGDVVVGDNCWIGPFTVLDGSGGLTVGSGCTISAGTQIYSHDSVARTISGGTEPFRRAPTVIGQNCYLGPQVVVSAGVTIGDRAIIGAHSLVMTDIPPDSTAFGTPCRIHSRRADS